MPKRNSTKYTKEEVQKIRSENRVKLDQEFNSPQKAAIEIIMLLNDIKFILLRKMNEEKEKE